MRTLIRGHTRQDEVRAAIAMQGLKKTTPQKMGSITDRIKKEIGTKKGPSQESKFKLPMASEITSLSVGR